MSADQDRADETSGAPRASAGEKPDSTGTNARPRNDTISQTGPGIPDDSSAPVEVDPKTEQRIEDSIRKM